MTLTRLGASPERNLVVGDRPDTAGAKGLDLNATQVRAGRFGPCTAWPGGLPRPDLDVADLEALMAALKFPAS